MLKTRVILSMTLAICFITCAGCGLLHKFGIKTPIRPTELPVTISQPDSKKYESNSFRWPYDAAMGFRDYSSISDMKLQIGKPAITPDLANAKRQRDRIIWDMIAHIDTHHEEFVHELWMDHAIKDTITDFITLGLNATGAVASSSSLKSILAAASAGTTGFSASIDKNVLANGTIQAIVLQMQANRAKVRTDINIGLASDVDKYNLEKALSDVINYYKAGTLVEAITNLSTSVNGDKMTAQDNYKKSIETLQGSPTILTVLASNTTAEIYFSNTIPSSRSPIEYVVVSNPDNKIGKGTSSPIKVEGLTIGRPYTFTVMASIPGGTTSPPSTASKTVIPCIVPGAPTSVTAVARKESAQISFVAPISNGGCNINSYTVTSNPGNFSTVGTDTSLIVSGLQPGSQYTFTVTATNAAGTGPPSAQSGSVTPYTIPAAPTITAVAAGDAQATVTFIAPANDGSSTITGYTVSSNLPEGKDTNAGTTSLTHIITGLRNGSSYTFKVTALNAAGEGQSSQHFAPVIPATTPSAPLEVIATPGPGQGQTTVTFKEPSDGGDAITSYSVTPSCGSYQSGIKSPIILIGLPSGKCAFKVKAINSKGIGPESESAEITVP